ncbi:MAG TPA: dihydrofolate reductase family protein [Pyrinomonadaceae bacterium]|nr:dihydrofolate reductase family protein [Pyrinomonadaceae bacterium]
MRKVIFGGANSLDNYFARKDDTVDWLMWSDEVGQIMADYWKTFDTIVMGRRTYEVALRSGHGDGSSPGMKTYVFSRTLKPATKKNLEITSEDVVDVVAKLKQEDGKDICIMGGGLLAKSLFEADLIDEIGFNIHPVLLGSGIPIFYEMDHQINLELIECRPLKNGCVIVTYRVKPPTVSAKKARKSRKQSKTKKT